MCPGCLIAIALSGSFPEHGNVPPAEDRAGLMAHEAGVSGTSKVGLPGPHRSPASPVRMSGSGLVAQRSRAPDS